MYIYIYMVLVVSSIMKLDFGHFITSGIGWDTVRFFLECPIGIRWHGIHDNKQLRGTQTLKNRIPCTHAGRVAVGCGKMGQNWQLKYSISIMSQINLQACDLSDSRMCLLQMSLRTDT